MNLLSSLAIRVRETFKPGPSQELAELREATARVTAAAVSLEKSSDKIGKIVREYRRGPKRAVKKEVQQR